MPPTAPLARAWLPVAACAAAIWTLGGDAFGHSDTSRFLGPLIRWLLPELDDESVRQALFWIRKLAHAAEYALLAVLAMRAGALQWPGRTRWPLGAALACVVALAASDEARQALSDVRTGSGWDVALDIAGGAGALAALRLLEASLKRPIFGAGGLWPH